MKKEDCFEINENDLLSALSDTVKLDAKRNFEDIVSLTSSLNREIYILGDISSTGENIECIIRYWNNLDNKNNIPVEERKPIKIYIDSCGGSLLDCFLICDCIKISKTPIYTIVIGSAYSSAFDICSFGHKRFAYKHSTFLFHEGSISGAGGTISQFQNAAAFNKVLIGKTKDYLIENTKITLEKYQEMKNEDWWMTAEEALEWGVIDEILEDFV